MQKNFEKLKVGGRYRSRNGKIFDITERFNSYGTMIYQAADGTTFYANGQYSGCSYDEADPLDLLSFIGHTRS